MRDATLRARLRRDTAGLHDEAERRLDLPQRLSSRQSYCDYLLCLWRLHAGFETAMAALDWHVTGLHFAARRRAHLLLDDLRAMDAAPFPAAPPAIALGDIWHGVGVLYVLEGSTLGGQVILRAATAALGVDAAHGAGFLAGHGRQNGAMWKALTEALDRIDPAHHDAIVDGASQTFAAFIKAFSQERFDERQRP
jgi:heme oxygenase